MARRKSEIEIKYTAANSDFKKAVSEMDREIKTLNKTFLIQKEQMKDTADQSEKLGVELENLKDKYIVGEQKIEKMRDALDNSIRVMGENSKEAQYWNDRLLDAQYAQEKLANKIKDTDKAYQDSVREMTGFGKKLENLQTESQYLEKDLKDIEKALAMDPGNMDLIEQKSRNLEKQMENTTQTVAELKAKQDKLDGDAYDKIKREVVLAEGKVKGLKDEIDKLDDSKAPQNLKNDLDDIGDTNLDGVMDGVLKSMDSPSLANLAGAFSAAIPMGETLNGIVEMVLGGIEEGWKKIKEHAAEAAILNASMDFLDESQVMVVQEAIDLAETYGIEAQDALIGVRKQWMLNKDASDSQNASIIQNASTIATKYSELDFAEVITETNKVASALKTSDEEAVSLINSLLDAGFPPEQIDTVAEYGKQLSLAGYNAGEIYGILTSAVDTGTWNIDQLLDGLKEGRIKMVEFGDEIDPTLGALLDKAGINQAAFQQLGRDIAEGGEKGNKAYLEVARLLQTVDDETTKNALGVQIYGTKWEDNGTDITDTITGMNGKIAETSTLIQGMNDDTQAVDNSPIIKKAKAHEELDDAVKNNTQKYLDLIEQEGVYADENILNMMGIEGTRKMYAETMDETSADILLRGRLERNDARRTAEETNAAYQGMNTTAQQETVEMKNKVLSNSESMKTGVTEDTNKMKNDVKGDLNSIKKAASELSWKIPRPKIPKFSLQGSLSLQAGTVPRIQTSWYKDGGYANKATLFGMGEAGGEGIVPLEGQHMYPFADAVAERITNNTNSTQIVINASLSGPQDYEELGRTIDRHLNRQSHEVKIVKGR